MAEPQPLQLALRAGPDTSLDGEELRAQLERELGVAVVLAAPEAPAQGVTLHVDAPTMQAVRVSVGPSERTVDLSSSGQHAVETLALVAAAMMRDEARDLLATLRASASFPAAEPARPAAATAAPPAKAKPAPAPEEPRGCAPTNARRVPLAANLVPYLGTSTLTGLDVEQTFALHLIGGAASSTRGFELAGVFNVESRALCGVQVAGVANIVSGPVQGLQLSMINTAGGRLDGVQTGFVNAATGSVHGLQLGFVDIATSEVHGMQAGFVNTAADPVDGAQLGFVNVGTAELDGAQLGFVNSALGDVGGLQLGFVNVNGGELRGLQLGFVNVSDNADAAIGVLSVHTHGHTHVDLWVTDAGLVMAGIEHGGRRFHNLYGAGLTARDGHTVFALAWGLGARVHDQNPWYVDVDAVAYGLITTQGTSTTDERSFDETHLGSILQLRVPIGYRLSPTVSLFAAPSISIAVAGRNDTLRDPSLYGAEVTNDGASTSATLWPGLSLGARLF